MSVSSGGVLGRRRVKTDRFDLEAITELLLTGRGIPVTVRKRVVGELTAWTDSSSFAAAVAARAASPCRACRVVLP
jgi:hypothetical protein